MSDSELINGLRNLMGYVGNGSDTDVTLFQDDATRTYHVRVGKDSYSWGNSLREALEKAIRENPSKD